ncbi:MAG: hypothetical protein ABI895_40305 [Deltaproteobacteria bacterium]
MKTIAALHRHARAHRSRSATSTASFAASVRAAAGRRSALLAAAACCLSLAGSALAAEAAKPTHYAILAYERRIHFAWQPSAFPAKCDLPSKAPVAAQ